jgi:hypothetical protein
MVLVPAPRGGHPTKAGIQYPQTVRLTKAGDYWVPKACRL